MRTAKILLAIAMLGGINGPASGSQASAPETPQVHEIAVTAKKYEFRPNPIRVAKGEHVNLVITALDHDHGFKLDEYGITQSIKKGTSVTIEFTADKAGTFPFHCSVFCGLGHAGMKGVLVVEE